MLGGKAEAESLGYVRYEIDDVVRHLSFYIDDYILAFDEEILDKQKVLI